MLRRSLCVIVLAALLVGCNGGSASPPPFDAGVAPLGHLYILSNSTPGELRQYALPITETSAHTLAIRPIGSFGLAVGPNGAVAVSDPGRVLFYDAPLSSGSVPAVSLSVTPNTANQLAFTSAGRLVVTDYGPSVRIYDPPFKASTAPSTTITAPGLTIAWSVALDAVQKLYVANSGQNDQSIFVFDPPYTQATIVRRPIPAGTPAGQGLALSATQLFVLAASSQGRGRIDVYDLPITAASTPAFSMARVPFPNGIAVDSAGNLYVTDNTNAMLHVFAPPFSAQSVPRISVAIPYNLGQNPTAFALTAIAIGK
jgi:sugar lactone lactonase YvrE